MLKCSSAETRNRMVRNNGDYFLCYKQIDEFAQKKYGSLILHLIKYYKIQNVKMVQVNVF